MRNPWLEAGDQLGWMVYVAVMGGGIPYWPALFLQWEEIDQELHGWEQDGEPIAQSSSPHFSKNPGEQDPGAEESAA